MEKIHKPSNLERRLKKYTLYYIERERPLERPSHGWKDHVTMDSEQMG